MSFRVATESPEAISAYQKFLTGEPLVETKVTVDSIEIRLPAKIHRIQKELPTWVNTEERKAKIQPLMEQLVAAIKASDLNQAEKIADEILKLLDTK